MSRPEPGPGSVIAFQLQLGGRAYSYAAINVGGQWATTSRAGAPLMTWAQLDAVLAYADHVYVASGWTELVPMTAEQSFARFGYRAQQTADYFNRLRAGSPYL
jgi:hypothetical protein